MINRNNARVNDCLFDQTRENAARSVRGQLEMLLRDGENLDINDCESVQEWINAVFGELKSFPSEHLSFRLHCLHTGLVLLSISVDKAEKMEQPALSDEL